MSFFSRFFRKAQAPSPRAASAALPTAPPKTTERSAPRPSAADRALAAAAHESALQSALAAHDVQALARLVVEGASTKVRQAAAIAIDDPDVLRQLIRDVRGGNDKGVYRILTSKREALLEQARQQEQVQAELDAAAADLERHSQRAYDAFYGPRLDEFESRWEALAAQADPELCSKVRQWIDRSRETVAEHVRQVAAEAAREQAAAEAAAEAQRLHEQETQAAAAAAAEQAGMLEEQRDALTEEAQAERQAHRQIGELIRKARGALSGGSSARAASVRRTIEEKLLGAPPLPAPLADQLLQLDQQLDELKDWKRFSVTPKRAELIEEMESLVDSSLDPLALADRIKSLKDEWRILGKGVGEDIEADAQRFQEAAKKAFLPCSEYFAAQDLVREENLRRREVLLAGLTAFEAATQWEQQPDWRTVIGTLREAKQEWRRCSPVDPQAARQQQEVFAALTARLQGRVDAEHARNLKVKESLIERARLALGDAEGRKATDAIKAMQQQWRTVGPVPREADQRLWAEFRRHCDAVFQKREQESAAFAAGLENNKLQAIALCEQVEAIAALEGPELRTRAAARIELRRAFEALGELPRADARNLHDRLGRALAGCEKALARQHARDAEQGWNDLFEAANHVRAYTLARALGLDAVHLGSLKAAADACMASVAQWPKDGLDTLRQVLAHEVPADLAANEAALRMLCIRAEIRSDLPTPPEDQAPRRDYQLQRLVQQMGQGLRADEAQWDSLALEWLRVGPVEQSVYASLLRRFRRCRDRGDPKGQ